MTEAHLADLYRGYIACLNRQDWPNLGKFVADDARHNGRPFGLAGYRAMLERDFGRFPTFSSTSNSWSANRPMSQAGSGSTAGRRVCFSIFR